VGKVVTIERDPLAAAIARRFFERSAFTNKIELRHGDASEELALLAAALGQMDGAEELGGRSEARRVEGLGERETASRVDRASVGHRSGGNDGRVKGGSSSAAAGEAFDLVFLDAGKRDYLAQRQMLVEHGLVRVGGLVIADNVIWAGEVPRHWQQLLQGDAEAHSPARDRRERVTRSLYEYVEKTAEDSRWQQLVMPLRDGLSVARRLA
jgi:predicted O-methyltransferase YrrM